MNDEYIQPEFFNTIILPYIYCCTWLILNSDFVVIKLVYFDVAVTYGHGVVEIYGVIHAMLLILL